MSFANELAFAAEQCAADLMSSGQYTDDAADQIQQMLVAAYLRGYRYGANHPNFPTHSSEGR